MRRFRPLAMTALFILCSAIFTGTAFAQYRAGIQGVVTDANGGLIPDARVTLTNKGTNVQRIVNSDAAGVFTITGLGPGNYSITVEKTGFSKKVLSDVQIAAEQMQSVNVQLEVGQISESITVEAPVTQVIDTETAIIGGTITARDVTNLPAIGRDVYELLRLAPGVFGDGAMNADGGASSLPGFNMGAASVSDSIFKVENGPQISANGTRQNSNDIQIDGIGVNSTSWGGAAVVTPNLESVKEVRIIANNYSAEFGRNSGAQVLVVSQSGANEPHGSAFFKWHRPGLNSYQKWNGPGSPSPVSKDMGRFNQFGGSVGGAAIKNKLFLFFSYETQRNKSNSVGTGWYETSNYLQNTGASSSIARKFLSYPGMAASVGNIINMSCDQAGGIPSTQCRAVSGGLDLGSPLKTGLGTKDPTYQGTGTPWGIGSGFDGVPDVMFVQTASPYTGTFIQYNGRADYQLSNKDLVAFSSYFVPVSTVSYNGPARAANLWNHDSLAQSWSAIYTRTFSATMVNEARFGASGWKWDETNSNPQEPFGLPTANFDGVGGVGVQQFGPNSPSIFDQLAYNARDTLTKIHGSHSLKFGADITHATFLDSAPWNARPNYNFHNLWDFANDAPYHENSGFDPVSGVPSQARKDLRFNILGFFVQDDWKIRRNLTLNLGLRWEYFGPLHEIHGNVSNPILGQGTAVLSGLHMQVGGNLFNTSKNNWGPQFGFAWSPASALGHEFKDRLVVRGGFGIGYNLQQLAITSNGRFNPPFMTNLDLYGSDILYATASDLKSAFTGWPSNPVAKQTFDPSSGLPTSGAKIDLTGFPDRMPSTVTYRFSLDAQYDLGHNWAATLGFQGSQSRHYTRQSRLDWLFYPASNPRVNSLGWYANDLNSHFNAMLGEVQHRFARDFEIDFQYRYSRMIDQGSHDYNMDPYPFNYSLSTGPSDFDATHNFKLWGVWTPTIFRGANNWMEKVAGGWTVSGIVSWHSGFPWNPQYCNTGGSVIYPDSGYWNCLLPANYSGGAGTDYSNSNFMTTGNFPKGALSYFTVPTWPKYGAYPAPSSTVHRNMFRGPGFLGNDFQLAKAFGLPKMKILGEGARLNFQANFYNMFNKLNVKGIDNTFSSDGVTSNANFGKVTGAYAGRIVELQARFNF